MIGDSRIYLFVPTPCASMTPTPERGPVMIDGKSKTVLVADHNSPTLNFLAQHLDNPDKCSVLTARSAVGALAMAQQYQPDIAIVAGSLVDTGTTVSLPELIKDVSP